MPGEAAGMFFDVLASGDRSQYGEALILIDGHHFTKNERKQKLVLMLLKQTGPDQCERAGLFSHYSHSWDASFVQDTEKEKTSHLEVIACDGRNSKWAESKRGTMAGRV
jgi:hypothetical protein